MAANTLLIDTTLCTGCRGCQVACKNWNGLPAEATSFNGSYENPPQFSPATWTRVIFREVVDAEGQFRWHFAKSQCLHCQEAVCVQMCPVQAAHYTDLGTVDIDTERCIGCGICQASCPFQVPRVDPVARKSRKCRLCPDRLSSGRLPACVQACPSGALGFGSREEMLSRASERAAALAGRDFVRTLIYGEKELGGLGVLYLLADQPSAYGLPDEPRVSLSASLLADLLRPLQGAAAAAAVLERAERLDLAGRDKLA